MYISAGDAKLKGQNIHHTLERGNIAEQVEQPICTRIVKCAVNNRQQHRNNGKKVEPSFLHAAFEKHHYECGKGTQHLPAYNNEVGKVNTNWCRSFVSTSRSNTPEIIHRTDIPLGNLYSSGFPNDMAISSASIGTNSMGR